MSGPDLGHANAGRKCDRTMDGHKLHERGIATLFAAVFLFMMWSDAYGLHTCPHHDWLPGAESVADVPPSHAHGGSGALTESEGATEHDSHDGPCTCIGDCDATSSAVRLAPSATGKVFPAAVVVSVSTGPAVSAEFEDSPYRLPLPNAPPLA
jgi:hypothetical protein